MLRERERFDLLERLDLFECLECLDCEEERLEVEREERELLLLVAVEVMLEMRLGFLVIQNFKTNNNSALKASPGVTYKYWIKVLL